jgi:energy-coupling factor transport system ATP-binding protein
MDSNRPTEEIDLDLGVDTGRRNRAVARRHRKSASVPTPAAGAVIDVRDAFCVHPLPDGAVVALRGLTLAVDPGERVVIHGPNGSGKSTLMRVIAGEQRLTAGRATVAGVDLANRTPPDDWRRRSIGWVDQRPSRLLRPELDVIDNVGLQLRLMGRTRHDARHEAIDSLNRLDLADLANRTVATLSGGEAQRVAIAAALAHRPPLVLADEPSGELDRTNADMVYDLLARACVENNASLVLVSHDRAAARAATRVVRIRDGRLSETWRPSNPHDEHTVVDERGWLRLPETMRPVGGTEVRVDQDATGRIVIDALSTVKRAEPAAIAPRFSPAGTQLMIEATGVSAAVGDRRTPALDFNVHSGTLHVVVGPSGSGKSTLLRLLSGLQRPVTGHVRIDGRDLATLNRAGLADLRRRSVGMVLQDVHLAETLDTRANLALGRAARGLDPNPDLVEAVLDDLLLTSFDGRPVAQLSGGERQRVAMARVLAEPTSQLDEGMVLALAALLRRCASAGTTIVVATHDPVLTNTADRITTLT